MSRPFDRLAEAVASLRQPAKISSFLQELLTPSEFHDLGLRWELVELLVAGMSQRQIAAKLGISLCKITRGAKILKKRNGAVAELVAGKAPAKSAPKAKPVKKGSARPVKPAARPGVKAVVRKPVVQTVKKSVKGGKNGSRVARKS